MKNRMIYETYQRSPFKDAGVEPPVELHHCTGGGIANEFDRIREKVES